METHLRDAFEHSLLGFDFFCFIDNVPKSGADLGFSQGGLEYKQNFKLILRVLPKHHKVSDLNKILHFASQAYF